MRIEPRISLPLGPGEGADEHKTEVFVDSEVIRARPAEDIEGDGVEKQSVKNIHCLEGLKFSNEALSALGPVISEVPNKVLIPDDYFRKPECSPVPWPDELAGVSCDWDFSQSQFLRKMRKSKKESRRILSKRAKEGLCGALVYDWLVLQAFGKAPTKCTYAGKSSGSRAHLIERAKVQVAYSESGQGIGFFVDKAKADGVRFVVPAPTNEEMVGEFGDEELIKHAISALDALEQGVYWYELRGTKRHALGVKVEQGGWGVLFDPNLGQITLTKDTELSLGEYIVRYVKIFPGYWGAFNSWRLSLLEPIEKAREVREVLPRRR